MSFARLFDPVPAVRTALTKDPLTAAPREERCSGRDPEDGIEAVGAHAFDTELLAWTNATRVPRETNGMGDERAKPAGSVCRVTIRGSTRHASVVPSMPNDAM